MPRTFFLFFYFLSLFSILSSEECFQPQEVATTEGLPSSIVNQSVCAITGEYIDSVVDLMIPGPKPLTIHRMYASHSEQPWFFGHQENVNAKTMLYQGKESSIFFLNQPSGSCLHYFVEAYKKAHRIMDLDFIKPKGLTNGSSILSGKTNLKNQKVRWQTKDQIIEVTSGAGSRKKFEYSYLRERRSGFYLLTREDNVNGISFSYQGEGTKVFNRSLIRCEHGKSSKPYSQIHIRESNIGKDSYIETLSCSDGRELKYFFDRDKHYDSNGIEENRHHRYYLKKMEHDYAPKEEYEYQNKSTNDDLHLTCKSRDKGKRFVEIEYYQKGKNQVGGTIGTLSLDKHDFRLDRVKKLRAPVGTDATSITTHRFDYHAEVSYSWGQQNIEEGYTDVYDSKNHKIRYRYDKDHRLTSVIKYSGSTDHSLYSEETYQWDQEGNLTSQITQDQNGAIHHVRMFSYDSKGNVTKSKLYGVLTGKTQNRPFWDDNHVLITDGCDCERKTYTYSDDGLNLLLSEKDYRGKKTEYRYEHKSDRLRTKLVSYDNRIQLREFYSYDNDHVLIKKIVDNGSGESHDKLDGVTERRITNIHPRSEAPYGLPESSEEWAEDYQDGKLIKKGLLTKNVYVYSKQGRLLEQQVFDADNLLAYTLYWEYDLHGNVTGETRKDGVTTERKYDLATDNLLEEQTLDVTTCHTHDYANRLIEQREVHPDEEFITRFGYDTLGNRISTFNPLGHETKQVFDEFGRVIETRLSEVSYKGELASPRIRKTYDIAGFPSSVTDPNGNTTLFEVNIRGQATKIIHPDGTTEQMTYSLDGLLSEKIDRNGTRTKYHHDPLGRVIEEIVYGDSIKRTIYEYDAFHLVRSIDPEKNITSYTYELGRLKETRVHDKRTEQFYDALGRISEIREYFGSGAQDYRKTIRRYDNADRIIEEKLQAEDGTTLHFSCYEYDERGNCILSQTGDQKTLTTYNSRNQPIRITDGLGHETHMEYNIHFINAFGQRVLQTTTTDPQGYRTLETFDAADRLVEKARLNPFGIKVACQRFSYDLCGNEIKTEVDVIEEGREKRTITTLFSYNANHDLIQTIEAAGTPEQKVTSIRYNSFGQKEALIKPDGTEISYTYHQFCHLQTLSAPDLSYRFEYDLLDQVTKVVDRKTGRETTREYAYTDLMREGLENGLSVKYTYDQTGRACTITFPDETGLEYVYDAVDLKEIRRLVDGKIIYTHCDMKHSLSGQVLQAKIAGNNNSVDYSFDPIGRCTSIQAKTFNQHVPPDGFDPSGNLLKFERQKIPYAFFYDDNFQLNSEQGHVEHIFKYDSVSNRTVQDFEKYSHNDLNQLLKIGDQKLEYDLNGNLVKRGDTVYSYDSLDRLTRVHCDGITTTYTYDPFNRRMSKVCQGEKELFLYQGQDEIGNWRDGKCQELCLLGKNPLHRIAAIELEGIPYVSVLDMFGNVSQLLNLSGDIIEQYRYSAFGETQVLSPNGQHLPRSAVRNPWQYAGKRLDEESGLIAFGMRYYDPTLGKWTTPDPLGFEDGPNLYAYVHNSPLQYSDQFGLYAELVFGGIGHYTSLEREFNHLSSPIGFGAFWDPAFPQIFHMDLETKMEDRFRQKSKVDDPLFLSSRICCINDFVNPATGENYQFKEFPRGKLVAFSNGIMNDKDEIRENLLYFAKMTGYNVKSVFTPTRGFLFDLLLAKKALSHYLGFEGTRLMQKMVNDFHDQNLDNPNATMLTYAHSRGAIYQRNAQIDSPPHLRNRVDFVGIAPGAFLDKELCHRVRHYESARFDIVTHLDRTGRERCRDTIRTLQPHPDASKWHDHSARSPTFKSDLKNEFKRYMGQQQ